MHELHFLGEGANLEMSVLFKVEKDDRLFFIKCISTRDVTFPRVNHT